MKKITLDEYRSRLLKVSNDYSIIDYGEPRRTRTRLIFKHICGCEFTTDFSSLKSSIIKSNGGCPICANNKRRANLNHKITKTEFEKYLIDSNENQYIVENVWFDKKSNRSYARLQHTVCGEMFNQRINDFKNGYRCPICAMKRKESSLTNKIREYLDTHKMIYLTEFNLPVKRTTNRSLRVDFAVNEEFFIESDGEQHFKQKAHRENIKITHERDVSKDDFYFKNKNNLYYIRIPYTKEKNIKDILDLFFKKEFDKLTKYRIMLISRKTMFNYSDNSYYTKNLKRKLS